MKKCPMTIDIGKYHPQSKHGGNDITKSAEYYTFATDCIGSDCAAYRERNKMIAHEDGGYTIDLKTKEWTCYMMPQQNWHDVTEESK